MLVAMMEQFSRMSLIGSAQTIGRLIDWTTDRSAGYRHQDQDRSKVST